MRSRMISPWKVTARLRGAVAPAMESTRVKLPVNAPVAAVGVTRVAVGLSVGVEIAFLAAIITSMLGSRAPATGGAPFPFSLKISSAFGNAAGLAIRS